MKRFLKSFRYGQRGFTLIELLIVIAILGIMAVVVVPNLAGFLTTGRVAAANTEAANVETAAIAYMAENDGVMPEGTDSTDLTAYLSSDLKATYNFDDHGKISSVETGHDWTGLEWNDTKHQWVRATS